MPVPSPCRLHPTDIRNSKDEQRGIFFYERGTTTRRCIRDGEKFDFFTEMSRVREMNWTVIRISFTANADGDNTTVL